MVAVMGFIAKVGCTALQEQTDNPYEKLDWDLKNESERFQKENFFSSFGPHKMPLYFCDQGTHGNRFFLPDIPECSFNIKTPNSERILYNVTFWMRDSNLFNIKGWHCYGLKREKVTYYTGFFQEICKTFRREPPIITPVDFEECKRMVYEHKSPDGKTMKYKEDGVYAREQDPDYEYGWPNVHIVTWIDYYAEQYDIGVDPVNSMITTLATIVKDCSVEEEKCKTQNGYLIWKSSDYNKCNLVISNQAVCVWTGDIMICPTKNMYLTGLKTTNICDGMKMAVADQILMFSPDSSTWDSTLNTTSQFKQKVRRRSERGTISSQGMLNAQMEYVQNVFLKNLEVLSDRICSTQQIAIRGARAEAEDGRPDRLAQAFFGRGFRATMEGQVILVWTCKQVNSYRFERQTNVCTREWPLRFILDGVELSGYIGNSYEISTDNQEVKCPPPPFYFKVGNDAYLLNELDNLAIRYFQTMAVPGDADIAKDWQRASFKESGDLELKDMGCPTCFRALTRSISRHIRIWESLENPNAEFSNLPPAAQGLYGHISSMVSSNNIYIALLVVGAIVVIIPASCCCIYCKCIKHCGKCCGEAMDQIEELNSDSNKGVKKVGKGLEARESEVRVVSIYPNLPSASYQHSTTPQAALKTKETNVYPKLTQESMESNTYPEIVDTFNDF